MAGEWVWVALKRCGCCVGACKDENATEYERVKWLKDGLSVLQVSRADWDTKYRPTFLADCKHVEANLTL